MRRGVGISGLKKQQEARAIYAQQGTIMQEEERKDLDILYEEFKTQLEEFSNQHFEAISKNSVLREKLTILCNKFEINILSKKNMLHTVIGNFYLQLGVFIIEILNQHQIIEKQELVAKLCNKTRQSISLTDVEHCLKSLKPLGHIEVLVIENSTYISIVQVEHVQLLSRKSWTVLEIINQFELSNLVAQAYFDDLIKSGIGWIDSVEERVYIGGY